MRKLSIKNKTAIFLIAVVLFSSCDEYYLPEPIVEEEEVNMTIPFFSIDEMADKDFWKIRLHVNPKQNMRVSFQYKDNQYAKYNEKYLKDKTKYMVDLRRELNNNSVGSPRIFKSEGLMRKDFYDSKDLVISKDVIKKTDFYYEEFNEYGAVMVYIKIILENHPYDCNLHKCLVILYQDLLSHLHRNRILYRNQCQ